LNKHNEKVHDPNKRCNVKPHGGDIPKIKGPRIRHEMSLAPHHGNVPYPWASPIVLYNMQPMLS